MTHHFYSEGAGSGCPTCGYGATFTPGGFAPGMQMGRWPFFGPYGPGFAFHPAGYPVAGAPPVDDREIRRMVTEYLKSDPRLSPQAEITIDVTDGVVALHGTVPDKWTKYFAGEDCFNIPATVDVVNDLKIVERRPERKPRGRRGRTE